MLKLHHVGIVCNNAEYLQQKALLEVISPSKALLSQIVPEFECECHLLDNIEWVVPYGGSLLRWYGQQGKASIHHIAIEVQDIHDSCNKLTSMGIRLVTKTPTVGVGNILVNFIHPTVLGIMLELVQIQ